MATYQQRGDSWRAIIRRAGHKTKTRTFPSKQLAEKWAMSVESAMLRNEFEEDDILRKMPAYVLLRRYRAEISVLKKSGRSEALRIEAAERNYPHLFNRPLYKFGKQEVIAWRDDRLKKVKASTVLREWNTLSAIWSLRKNTMWRGAFCLRLKPCDRVEY